MRASKELGVEFAFPTTTLHIDSYSQEKTKNPEKPLEELKTIAKSYKNKANPMGVGLYHPIFEKNKK